MTGPPTPPPTSAIEIQDAARSSEPPSTAQATTAPAEPPKAAPPAVSKQFTSSYQFLFPALADLAVKGELQEVVKVAERGDLNADGDNHVSRLLLTTPLVLSYLILDDLPPARHALMRLPEPLKAHPLSRALFSLLASVWEKKFENVYPRAEELRHLAQQPIVPDYDSSTVVSGLIQKFLDSFRQKTFALLSKAYTSIPLPLVQTYLGWSSEQVITAANEYKWSYNASTQILAPVPVPTAVSINGSLPGSSSLATFNLVASTNLDAY